MTVACKWGYLLVLAVWLGSIIFFSFVVAPTIFKVLDPEAAARLQRALFPKYYLLGMICSALGIVCVAYLLGADVMRTPTAIVSLLLLAGGGAADVWMRQGVMPQMVEIREKVAAAQAAGRELGPELEADWKTMHQLSVRVNGAVLLCLLVLLFVLVYDRMI